MNMEDLIEKQEASSSSDSTSSASSSSSLQSLISHKRSRTDYSPSLKTHVTEELHSLHSVPLVHSFHPNIPPRTLYNWKQQQNVPLIVEGIYISFCAFFFLAFISHFSFFPWKVTFVLKVLGRNL